MNSSAVNRPTDPKVKAQDVKNKLQLYGIYSAFAEGKAPSNKQIDIALNSALKSRPLANPSKKLSAEGRELVADVRDVIEKAKILLLTKNEGNLIQDFIWQAQNIDGGDQALPGAQVDKDTAKQHGNEALEGIKTLGTLIISNGQFRKLLSDAGLLIRDMLGDAAQKAAEKVNPSDEQLNQIDKPAPDNQWHEVPDLSKGNLKDTAKNMYNDNIGIGKDDLKAAAGDASETAHPSGSRDPQDVGRLAARDQQQGTSSGVDAQAGAQRGAQSALDRSNISQEDQDRAKDVAETAKNKTKNYLQEKIPEERRDQAVHRLKKMIVEIQSHPDYQDAINTLLDLAETYTGYAQQMAQDAADATQGAHSKDSNLQKAEKDLKVLIERFANYTSTDDLLEAFNNIYNDAQRDPELKNWFKHLDTFVRKSLKKEGYVLTDEANKESDLLYDQGQFLLRDRYKDHTNRVLDEFKFLGDQFAKDDLSIAFGEATKKLFLDLGNDENGKATFKPHLIQDVFEVIIPGLFENIRYVPIPRIEYSDPQIDAIVENLIVESDNLFPNMISVTSDNHFKWGRKSVVSRNKNKIGIAVSGVQMDLRDVSYYIKKKEGFPSVKDIGIMDIFMGGEGFSFDILLETADEKDRRAFFKCTSVTVNIKNLKLKMKQSNHKLLFNLFKPLLLGVVKPALTKVIEKQIKEYVAKGDAFCYEIYKDAQRAAEEAKENPENAPNTFQNYWNAVKDKFTEKKQKAQEKTPNAQTNLAITQHDSIFKNIKLPGGISSQATEYKNLAKQGDRWSSPIFSIGSASESTGLPSPRKIQRRPHETAKGELVDKEGHSAYANGNPAHDFSGGTRYGQTDTSNVNTTSTVNNNSYSTSQYASGTQSSTSQSFGNELNTAFNSGSNTGGLKQVYDGKTSYGAANPVLYG